MYMFVKVENSNGRLSQIRLIIATIELFTRKWVQSHLGLASQASGRSIMVDIKIFSIVVGLRFLGGQFREFVLWPP